MFESILVSKRNLSRWSSLITLQKLVQSASMKYFTNYRGWAIIWLGAKHISQHYPPLFKNDCGDRLGQRRNTKLFMIPQMKEERKEEVERRIQQAIQHYQSSNEPWIWLSVEKFGVASSTLWGQRKGREAQATGHLMGQVLSEYEEKSIVRWCEQRDKWGHPAHLAEVKGLVAAMVTRQVKDRTLGRN